jgi:hypothetical protein
VFRPSRLGEGYEHPIRADGVRKVPQHSPTSPGVAAQHAVMPQSLRRRQQQSAGCLLYP